MSEKKKATTYTYNERTAKKDAKRDARAGVVDSELEGLTQTALEYGNLGQQLAFHEGQGWVSERGTLLSGLKGGEFSFQVSTKEEAETKARLAQVAADVVKSGANLNSLPVWVGLAGRRHITLLSIIGAGEAVYNLVVFRMMLEPLPLTIVMSTATALIFPLCAEMTGMFLHPDTTGRSSDKVRKFFIGAFAVGPALGLSGLSWLRAVYLKFNAAENEVILPVDPLSFTGVSFVLNALFYLGAIGLSWAANHPKVKNALREHSLNLKALKKAEQALGNVKRKVGQAVALVEDIGQRLVARFHHHRLEVEAIRACTNWLVTVYRKWLARYLKGRWVSRSKEEYPEIKMPVELSSLDYGLDEQDKVLLKSIYQEVYFEETNTNHDNGRRAVSLSTSAGPGNSGNNRKNNLRANRRVGKHGGEVR